MRCVGVSSMMPGLAPLASSNLVGHHQCLELLQCGNANRAVYVDLDDTVGRWHLQDQVPIVGDSHELVQGRLTKMALNGRLTSTMWKRTLSVR
jgi:hypothetical protein